MLGDRAMFLEPLRWMEASSYSRDLGGLADPARIDVVLGKGKPALNNLLWRLMVGCPYFLRYLSLR